MSIDKSKEAITDMGLLAYFAYENPTLPSYQDDFDTFEAGGLIYTLNSEYTVIDFLDTPITDTQAVLLNKTGTSDYIIAFRGTEKSAGDIISDILIGYCNFNPQFSVAKEFVQKMMAEYSISASNLTLTGHSLGGILSQSIGADMHIQAYAYNGYGTNSLSSLPEVPIPFVFYTKICNVLDILGIDAKNDPWLKDNLLNISYQDEGALNGDILSNLATNFSSWVASNEHLGGLLPIFGGNTGLDGHSIARLNDALAHYNDLLSHFVEGTTYKNLSDAYLFGGQYGYTRAQNSFDELGVNKAEAGSLHLNLLNDLSTEQLISLAHQDNADGLATRYALARLNPFMLTGENFSYDQFNQNGELDMYNPETGQGLLTENYINDRALFLSGLMNLEAVENSTSGDWDFSDFAIKSPDGQPLQLKIDGNGIELTNHQIMFGDENANEITGDTREDHLYGGNGNDTLTGGKGNDILEGGAGIDTYKINTGDGHDTIIDQGMNILFINGQVFSGTFVDTGDQTYHTLNGDVTIAFHSPGILTINEQTSITFANQDDSGDFSGLVFGINFAHTPEPDPNGWKGFGDQQDHRSPAGQWYWTEDGNLVTRAGISFSEPYKADILFGRLNSDAGDAGLKSYNDLLSGQVGDDWRLRLAA